MTGKQRTFDKETRIKIEGALDNLPKKPKAERSLTTKDLVGELKAKIKAAQVKGYALEEIVELFKQNGAQICLSTVKSNLKGTTKKAVVKTTNKSE